MMDKFQDGPKCLQGLAVDWEKWPDHEPVFWYKDEKGHWQPIMDHEIELTVVEEEKDQ